MEKTLVEPIEEAVLRELKQKPVRPVDLLEHLVNQGYTTFDVKLTLAQLLHDGQVELTSERVLHVA
jgi:hypothetical protein